MKILPQLLLTLAIVALPSSDAMAQRRKPQAGLGDLLVQPCFACHGPKGISVAGPMPIIGGQKEAYLNAAMRAFRDGSRPSTVMGRLMRGYTEAEIAAMAASFARLSYVGAAQTIDPARAKLGREAWGKACKRCHLDGGRDSTEAEYPILAGQWLPYLQMTMVDILNGKHVVDDKFRTSLDKLTPDEIDATLHFYASQR